MLEVSDPQWVLNFAPFAPLKSGASSECQRRENKQWNRVGLLRWANVNIESILSNQLRSVFERFQET
jgi:hypothetical protein